MTISYYLFKNSHGFEARVWVPYVVETRRAFLYQNPPFGQGKIHPTRQRSLSPTKCPSSKTTPPIKSRKGTSLSTSAQSSHPAAGTRSKQAPYYQSPISPRTGTNPQVLDHMNLDSTKGHYSLVSAYTSELLHLKALAEISF